MTMLQRYGKVLFAGALTATLGFGVMTAHGKGKPPKDPCGASQSWYCTGPGIPPGLALVFDGNRCEKEAFEAQTGLTCSSI
mgnify:CR=1 FL=1